MEIILKTDLGEVEPEDYNHTKEEFKDELKQVLFEICEDWVLRGQEPELEYS